MTGNAEVSVAKVLGIGGVFIRSPDPAALNAWYARVLGLEISSWGGATFEPMPKGSTTWSPFAQSSSHFEPSSREVMINLVVDDLDAMAAKLEAEGVTPLARDDGDAQGRFLWLLDLDGTKLELWEPPKS